MAKTKTLFQFVGTSENYGAYGCFSINFYRPLTNTNPVSVDGIPIEAGSSLSISQNVGDSDQSFYEIRFTETVQGNNALHITRITPID
jgi:hypothetical protein